MKSILVANWKMNPASFREAKALLAATKKAAEKAKHVTVIVAPPALYMRELRSFYKGKRLAFAVQHAHFDATGSHTGDISLAQARDAKATYAIIGHAERRAQGEKNEDVRKKMSMALKLGITPILCIGETSRSGSGEHFTFVAEQLKTGLADVPKNLLKKVLIAYEPVWAIGGSSAMTARDMHEMAIFIRKTIVTHHGDVGMQMRILYGGSIDETNAADMRMNGDVEGLLVGRASADTRKIGVLIDALNGIAI